MGATTVDAFSCGLIVFGGGVGVVGSSVGLIVVEFNPYSYAGNVRLVIVSLIHLLNLLTSV